MAGRQWIYPWAPTAVAALIIFVSAAVFIWALSAQPFKVCIPAEPTDIDRYQKTIAALDGIVDLSIKLGTALVGLGAALLLGLKSEIGLTSLARSLILVCSAFFAQSALYAVWWRMGVAEIWLNECLGLIAEPRLTIRYSLHFYFFMLGLAILGILVVISAARIRSK